MSRRPYEYLVSLGSNVESERHVPRVLAWMDACFGGVQVSPLYDVPAVGMAAEAPPFVNAIVRLRTDLTPRPLRARLRDLEARAGRRRSTDRFAPRTMDLDLVFAAHDVPDAEHLPHDDLAREAYVLVPAAAVWPDAVLPATQESLHALARERFPDWAAVHARANDA